MEKNQKSLLIHPPELSVTLILNSESIAVTFFKPSNVQSFGPLIAYIIQPSIFFFFTITSHNFKVPVPFAFIARKLGVSDNVHFCGIY